MCPPHTWTWMFYLNQTFNFQMTQVVVVGVLYKHVSYKTWSRKLAFWSTESESQRSETSIPALQILVLIASRSGEYRVNGMGCVSQSQSYLPTSFQRGKPWERGWFLTSPKNQRKTDLFSDHVAVKWGQNIFTLNTIKRRRESGTVAISFIDNYWYLYMGCRRTEVVINTKNHNKIFINK